MSFAVLRLFFNFRCFAADLSLFWAYFGSILRLIWAYFDEHSPDWQQNFTSGDPDLTHGKGVKINRKTWAWNAAAGVFAYAFGTLAEHGYLLVGHDQLVAGTWPDNEPAVAMLDWVTGGESSD